MTYFRRQPYRNKKMLAAAKGQDCALETEWCNHDPATVVACHSNWQEDGKGMGQKADDFCIADGCSGCHRWLDEGPASEQEKREVFHRGMKRTLRRRLDMGVLK